MQITLQWSFYSYLGHFMVYEGKFSEFCPLCQNFDPILSEFLSKSPATLTHRNEEDVSVEKRLLPRPKVRQELPPGQGDGQHHPHRPEEDVSAEKRLLPRPKVRQQLPPGQGDGQYHPIGLRKT